MPRELPFQQKNGIVVSIRRHMQATKSSINPWYEDVNATIDAALLTWKAFHGFIKWLSEGLSEI